MAPGFCHVCVLGAAECGMFGGSGLPAHARTAVVNAVAEPVDTAADSLQRRPCTI